MDLDDDLESLHVLIGSVDGLVARFRELPVVERLAGT